MSNKAKIVLPTLAVATMVGGFALQADDAQAKGEKEKCYGVAKAGKNDCASATGSHSCAGQAAADGEWHEWVLVSKGTCEKLVGGSLTPQEPS